MTDLHCHILPGMDDGAPDASVSLEMLRIQAEQGIGTVVLTPHFYRHHEDGARFLDRRAAAWDRLQEAMEAPDAPRGLPRLLLGAEVAWVPGLEGRADLERFCIGRTRHLLLELPFRPWTGEMFREIWGMMDHTGVVPVIAHIERYIKIQRRELLDAVFALGVPVQISAGPLLRSVSRGAALRMLRDGRAQSISSDCHDLHTRRPDMGPALAVLERKLGHPFVAAMGSRTDLLAYGSLDAVPRESAGSVLTL